MLLIKQLDFFNFSKKASISYLLKSGKCAPFSHSQQMASIPLQFLPTSLGNEKYHG